VKVIVRGKGGTGKTVITVLLAKILAKERRVYIIDMDESNILLPSMFGVDPPVPLVEFVGGKRDEEEFERMRLSIVTALSKAKDGIILEDLPSEFISVAEDGTGLLTVGKVREYGEGCACPFNVLARILLQYMELKSGEVILVDTDAGVEHVGRRLGEVCDGILVVVEPSLESLEITRLLREVALRLRRRFWVVLNKVVRDVLDVMLEEACRIGVPIDCVVTFDRDLFLSTLKRQPLRSGTAIKDLEALTKKMFPG